MPTTLNPWQQMAATGQNSFILTGGICSIKSLSLEDTYTTTMERKTNLILPYNVVALLAEVCCQVSELIGLM